MCTFSGQVDGKGLDHVMCVLIGIRVNKIGFLSNFYERGFDGSRAMPRMLLWGSLSSCWCFG